MSNTKAGMAWLIPVAQTSSESNSVGSPSDAASTAGVPSALQASNNTPSRKRKRSAITRLEEMDRKPCCRRLNCKGRFREDASIASQLRLEQDKVSASSSEPERKRFVKGCVPIAEAKNGAMIAAGTVVCTAFFCLCFGFSRNLITSAKGSPKAPASSSVSRKPRGWLSEGSQRCDVVAFLKARGDYLGQKMPDREITRLYDKSKSDVYDAYVQEQRELHGDASGACSRSFFNRVWRESVQSLKLTQGRDFMVCNICTLSKQTLYGTPGGPATEDPAVRKATEKDLQEHIEKVKLDRQVLANNKLMASRARAAQQVLRYVSMMVDAANQDKWAVPKQYPESHGSDRGWAERQKLQAVYVEGLFVDVFQVPQTLGTGSCMVCTVVWLALSRLYNLAGGPGPLYIDHLVLSVDNATGENKNNIMMSLFAMLVFWGVIGKVEVNFMQVGHTHNKIDQIFSRFAEGVKGRNVFTRSEQVKIIKASYKDVPVHVTTLRNEGNFKDLIKGRIRVIPHITRWRAFRLLRVGGNVVVAVKKFMHSNDWVVPGPSGERSADGHPHRLFVGPPPDLQGPIPPYTLKIVQENTIKMIQQRYEASRQRLASSYPADPGTWAAITAEQDRDMRKLRMKGRLPFDLPRDFLPRRNNDEVVDTFDDEDDREREAPRTSKGKGKSACRRRFSSVLAVT